MSEPETQIHEDSDYANDPIVTATRNIPWLIPLCGAAMMFCLALVAVFMGAP